MSEDFKRLPGPPRNPYVTLLLGVIFGAWIGALVTLFVLPSVSPSVEIGGLVTGDENGTMTIRYARLRADLPFPENMEGYYLTLEGTLLKVRAGWRTWENWI